MSEALQGYAKLQARIAALKGDGPLGKSIMSSLAAQAIREQKLQMYREVTRRTGHSGANVVVSTVTNTSAQTIARSTAAYIETGTRKHDIKPKNKKALFFSGMGHAGPVLGGNGRAVRLSGSVQSRFRGAAGLRRGARNGANLVFAMVVHHPGTKPHNFMVQGAKLALTKAGLADKVFAVWKAAK
jgi:hypothetical protein